MVSTKYAPYINYHEALNNPIVGENYSEVPLFIGKGTGTGSIKNVSEFKSYLDAKKELGTGDDSLAITVKEFYVENNNNTEGSLRVNKSYAMNLGASATVNDYLTALENSKYKKEATCISFTGLDWGAYTEPVVEDDERTPGSYANQATIKAMLISALSLIHEDGDDDKVNQMESGILRILYVPLPENASDEAIKDLMAFLRIKNTGLDANLQAKDSRLAFVENQVVYAADETTVLARFFGRTIARICNTPYYIEPGYDSYKSIPVGFFKERTPEERDELFNAGVIFNEDDYSLAEITPRICLAVSSAWGVDSLNDVDDRVNDALIHTRRNADYQVRQLLKIIAPQLKRNETSVNLAFVQTDCQLYLEQQVMLGRLMDFTIKVQEAVLNPYQLKVTGTMTPVNSTLAIEFENYIGTPYPVATDYI